MEVAWRPGVAQNVRCHFSSESGLEPKHARCDAEVCWSVPGPFYLHGSWDSYGELVTMAPCAQGSPICSGSVVLKTSPVPRIVRFQIVQDRALGKRFHPAPSSSQILGPDGDTESSWEVCLPAGCRELRVWWDPRGQRSLRWKLFSALGEMPELPLDVSAASFCVMGSWDSWREPVDLIPTGGGSFHAHVVVRDAARAEEFQVACGQDRSQRYGPALKGSGVVLTAGGQDPGRWRVSVPRGCRWIRIAWHLNGDRHQIYWSYLGPSGERVAGDGNP